MFPAVKEPHRIRKKQKGTIFEERRKDLFIYANSNINAAKLNSKDYMDVSIKLQIGYYFLFFFVLFHPPLGGWKRVGGELSTI